MGAGAIVALAGMGAGVIVALAGMGGGAIVALAYLRSSKAATMPKQQQPTKIITGKKYGMSSNIVDSER
jgi:uncharacterized membrane protein YfcA